MKNFLISVDDIYDLSKAVLTTTTGLTVSLASGSILAVNQDVNTSTLNSSTASIAAGGTFSGTGESTLAIVGIQVNYFSNTNANIYVDQSEDNINWDITDPYNYYTMNGGWSTTVQATSNYFRVRVWNYSTTEATTVRLNVAKCPIVEAVPRSLDEDGHFKVAVEHMRDNYDWSVENTPQGEMRVAEPVRLVGTNFTGSILDTNFWTTTSNLGATASLSLGELSISSGTYSTGTASIVSVRRARYIAGIANRFRTQLLLDEPSDNNIRRWGVFDASDGAFFLYNGLTMSVATRISGVDTIVPYTSWNTFRDISKWNLTNYQTYEIYWNNKSVYFTIGDMLVHKFTSTNTPWASTRTLPIAINSVNSAGATSYNIKCLVASVARLGKLESATIYKYYGTSGTYVAKIGSGRLHTVIIGDNVGTVVVYDDVSAVAANTILSVDSSKVFGAFQINTGFYNGLTVVLSANAKVSIIYE